MLHINNLSTAKKIRGTPTPNTSHLHLTRHKELNRNDLSPLPTQPNTPLHTLPLTRYKKKTANPLPTLTENFNSHEVLHKAISPLPKISETPLHKLPIKSSYTDMTFPLSRQSEIPNTDQDQHREYPSCANVTKHTFPTHHKVLQPEISHTSHMTWIYTYVTSQLQRGQDINSTAHKVLHRYDHSTVNTTRDIHHLTLNLELHRYEHITAYTNRDLPHLTEATQRLPFNNQYYKKKHAPLNSQGVT